MEHPPLEAFKKPPVEAPKVIDLRDHEAPKVIDLRDHFEYLPKHPGKFFELNANDLEHLANEGFRRIGVGVAILNTKGEVLVVEHRGSPKIGKLTRGLLSETVTAIPKNGQLEMEPIIDTVARAISEELNIDPASANFATRLKQPFVITEWPVDRKQSHGTLWGIDVAMLADEATAEHLVGKHATREVRQAYFMNPDDLLKMNESWDGGHVLRPGTKECVESLRQSNLLTPLALTEARLQLPAQGSGIKFDIDLASLRPNVSRR